MAGVLDQRLLVLLVVPLAMISVVVVGGGSVLLG